MTSPVCAEMVPFSFAAVARTSAPNSNRSARVTTAMSSNGDGEGSNQRHVRERAGRARLLKRAFEDPERLIDVANLVRDLHLGIHRPRNAVLRVPLDGVGRVQGLV